MKSFKDYLIESVEEKKYTFKLKVAGDIPEHFEDTAKSALEKYKVTTFNKDKTTPIQAKLPDFPTLENQPVTVFSLELEYPATSQLLTAYVAEHTGLDPCCVKVRSLKEEEEVEVNTKHFTEENKEALLTKDYEKESNQNLYGEKHISTFLKELSKQNKESQPTQYKGVNEKILAKSAPKEKSGAAEKNTVSKRPISGKGKTK